MSGKGIISYFSGFLALISSLLGMVLMLVIAVVILFFVPPHISGSVYGEILHGESATESAMLALLDLETDGRTISDWATYMVINGASATVDGTAQGKKVKDAISSTVESLGFSEYELSLSVEGSKTLISKGEKFDGGIFGGRNLETVRVPLFARGKSGLLEFKLYTGETLIR